MPIDYLWRGAIENDEVNALHAEAFGTRLFTADEWNWQSLLADHSLGWVTARSRSELVGFVNVIWDGYAHAWLQDTMVKSDSRRMGIGVHLIHVARSESAKARCEWLHVDFEENLGR